MENLFINGGSLKKMLRQHLAPASVSSRNLQPVSHGNLGLVLTATALVNGKCKNSTPCRIETH